MLPLTLLPLLPLIPLISLPLLESSLQIGWRWRPAKSKDVEVEEELMILLLGVLLLGVVVGKAVGKAVKADTDDVVVRNNKRTILEYIFVFFKKCDEKWIELYLIELNWIELNECECYLIDLIEVRLGYKSWSVDWLRIVVE